MDPYRYPKTYNLFAFDEVPAAGLTMSIGGWSDAYAIFDFSRVRAEESVCLRGEISVPKFETWLNERAPGNVCLQDVFQILSDEIKNIQRSKQNLRAYNLIQPYLLDYIQQTNDILEEFSGHYVALTVTSRMPQCSPHRPPEDGDALNTARTSTESVDDEMPSVPSVSGFGCFFKQRQPTGVARETLQCLDNLHNVLEAFVNERGSENIVSQEESKTLSESLSLSKLPAGLKP